MGKKMSFADYAKAKSGSDMSYEDYMKNATNGGLSYMGQEDYGKAETSFNAMAKSQAEAGDDVSGDALIKAIADYATVEEAISKSGGSRESFLADKQKGGTITKSEQQELGAIWAGASADTGDDIHKSLAERIADADADAAGLVDASAFLKSLVDGTNDALQDIGSRVERDGSNTRTLLAAQGQLLKSTATVLGKQFDLIKSHQFVIHEMGRRLGLLEGEPMVRKSEGSDPRDVANRRLGQAGAGGRGGPGSNRDALTKSQVQQGIRALIVKADAAGDATSIDRLAHASALFESSGQVHPNVAGAIRLELSLP